MDKIETKVTGKVQFARLGAPTQHEQYGSHYVLTLVLEEIDKQLLERFLGTNAGVDLEKHPLPMKERDDGTFSLYMKIRAEGKKKNGEVFSKKPKVKDSGMVDLDPFKIGLGSTVSVDAMFFPWEFNGKTGLQVQPKVVTVTDLVESKFEKKKPHTDNNF